MIIRGDENYCPNLPNKQPQLRKKYDYTPKQQAQAISTKNSQVTTTSIKKYQSASDVSRKEDNNSVIARLEKELAYERSKRKQIEEQTVREQMKVLDQINLLEDRFIKVENEKMEMKEEINKKDQELTEFKKCKGISQSMINMMRTVEGRDGDLHDAWNWVKKSISEYQSIKKKALEWKKVYDEAQKTFSSCSDLDSNTQ